MSDSDRQLKRAVKAFWNDIPCGTRNIELREGTKEFFNQLELERDDREPFISKYAQFGKQSNRRVLEVGVGAATDFIRFARAGAVLTGVDLTLHAVTLARKRLRLETLHADVLQADSEHLPFKDEHFDFVYSWGVIHHTVDVRKAAIEMMRVTRSGGEVCAMIYHRHSLVALQCWIINALLKGRPWRTLNEVIWHHIESIGTKAYSIDEARTLFSGLTEVKVTPIITPYDTRLTRSTFLPKAIRSFIPARMGWFLVVNGRRT